LPAKSIKKISCHGGISLHRVPCVTYFLEFSLQLLINDVLHLTQLWRNVIKLSTYQRHWVTHFTSRMLTFQTVGHIKLQNGILFCRQLLTWYTCQQLSVTCCNISFGAQGFCSAAPAIWNSLQSNVHSSETLTTFCRHLKSHLFHLAFVTA